MKTHRKKGFTIVELVIVIAVIAILAAVLIPTFSNVISKAQESNALQAARAAWTQWTAEHATTFSGKCGYVQVDSYWFKVVEGQFKPDVITSMPSLTGYTSYSVTQPSISASTLAASTDSSDPGDYLKSNVIIYLINHPDSGCSVP